MVAEHSDGPPPSIWQILRAWLGLGIQSFGGGTATLYLIQRAMVQERRWMTEDDFSRSWGVCQIAPGINLVAMTILIGWRIRRATGVALALFGLLFPSVTITILMTALYHHFQDSGGGTSSLSGHRTRHDRSRITPGLAHSTSLAPRQSPRRTGQSWS